MLYPQVWAMAWPLPVKGIYLCICNQGAYGDNITDTVDWLLIYWGKSWYFSVSYDILHNYCLFNSPEWWINSDNKCTKYWNMTFNLKAKVEQDWWYIVEKVVLIERSIHVIQILSSYVRLGEYLWKYLKKCYLKLLYGHRLIKRSRHTGI